MLCSATQSAAPYLAATAPGLDASGLAAPDLAAPWLVLRFFFFRPHVPKTYNNFAGFLFLLKKRKPNVET